MFSISSNRRDFPKSDHKKMKVIINQGGGIFGYIITNFMSYLDFNLYDKIDVVAGTSIGGILSLAYCINPNYKWLNKLFKLASHEIFGNKKGLLFNSCRYDDKNLEKLLKELFGDKKLSDIKDIYALITTTDYTLALPRIFENINIKKEDDISLIDLGLYTSAAPTFFPARKHKWKSSKVETLNEKIIAMKSFEIDKIEKDPETYHSSVIMDGGVLENIPIISTYTTLHSELGVQPEDLDIFVFGAGDLEKEKNHRIEEVNNWSVIDTLKNLIIPYVTDSNEMTSLYWGLQMGFKSFTYFNPIKISGGMDNLSIMPSIEEQCNMHKDEFLKEINSFLNK